MNDSTERLRQLIQKPKALDSLHKLANATQDGKSEEDLKGFWNTVAAAYKEVSKAFQAEGLKVEKLDRDYEPGFSVQDLPGRVPFSFWIEVTAGKPLARARRGSLVVSTPQLCCKKTYDLRDITEADVVGAVTYAYDKSFFR